MPCPSPDHAGEGQDFEIFRLDWAGARSARHVGPAGSGMGPVPRPSRPAGGMPPYPAGRWPGADPGPAPGPGRCGSPRVAAVAAGGRTIAGTRPPADRRHPREFGLLWRLSDHPGEVVSRRQLLEDVWRIRHDPETNSVEVHVSRLRSKLAACGCAALVATVPEGGYRLAPDADAPFMLRDSAAGPDDGLDAYLRTFAFAPITEKLQVG